MQMSMKDELKQIVGKNNISDTESDLLKYVSDLSLLQPGMAEAVVYPETSEQVSEVVKWANTKNIPVVPVSSKEHFYGCTIPKQSGVVVDLSKMNKIREIDIYNRKICVEAGVTWSQVTEELDKQDMRMIMPLLPHPGRSVLTDWLEREVPTNTVYDYGEPMQSLEVVWPTGELFRAGSASVNGYPDSRSKGTNPSGPGLDFYRFVQGAQGTMGIVTWTNLKIESKPKIDKVLFAAIDDLGRAQDFLYRILPRRIGQEVLLLNNVDLATILADKWPDDFEQLRTRLPAWTLILVVSGLVRRPEEKVAYEMEFLGEVMRNEFKDIALTGNLPGIPGIEKKLLSLLRKPWSKKVYWKNQWKGAAQSLFFIAKPSDTPLYISIVEEIAAAHGYALEDLGMYIQPIEHNRACHMEFNFFYNPQCVSEKVLIKSLYHEAAKELLNGGAFFTRPYGDLAGINYERAAGYTVALKRVKKLFDPNNIMNPGNLCF
jgi:FAD/FMN-containing dehydrogenase